MDVNLEDVAPLFICALMFLVLSKFFFILRNGFYVRVNCWFCNQNTKVLYSERNCFECPYCQQYNGFNKNGEYNKIITAQHAHTYNMSKSTLRTGTSFNGLCNTCNNNISLKVTQLASYEPLNDKNYDLEIEHFEKQLEKTYQLCKTCRNHVNGTIKRQNAWLFANRVQNHNKHKTTSQIALPNSRPPTWSLIKIFSLVFTILALLSVGGFSINILKDFTISVFPDSIKMTDFYKFMSGATKIPFDIKNIKCLPKKIKISETSLLSLIGLIFEMILTFFDQTPLSFQKLNKFISWIILALTSSARFGKDALSYANMLQIISCGWLLCSDTYTFISPTKKKSKRKFVLKKLSANTIQEEFSDVDDESSPENSTSSASINNSISGGYLSNTSNSMLSSFTPDKSARLIKTSSLLNIKLNNERLTNPNNLNTAKSDHLDKDFNSLNLGAFSQYNSLDNSSSFMRNLTSTNNPFMVNNSRSLSQNSMINNSYGWNTYRPSYLRSPFLKAPQNNHTENQPPYGLFISNNSFPCPESQCFVPSTCKNYFALTNSVLSDPRSQSSVQLFNHFQSPRENLLGCTQNSAFRPISSPQGVSFTSNRSVLSPPKFVNTDPRQLLFTVGSNNQVQSNMPYSPSNTSTVYKSFTNSLNNFELASQCDKFAESSRSSSRSSGFMSGNEINSRAVSLPSSRSHSPERGVYNHLKID